MDWVRSLGEKTLTLTDQTLEEIRRAVVTLGPAILDDFGLEVAVRRYCADFEDRTPETVVRCEIELPASGLSPALESACYRLVQEALTNIARHAEAHEVCVSLRVTGDGEARALVLEIETTEPGLQVYDGAMLATAPFAGHDGAPYGAHAGLALEPQGWPDAPNRPDFPSVLLRPGETYRQYTIYAFSVR